MFLGMEPCLHAPCCRTDLDSQVHQLFSTTFGLLTLIGRTCNMEWMREFNEEDFCTSVLPLFWKWPLQKRPPLPWIAGRSEPQKSPSSTSPHHPPHPEQSLSLHSFVTNKTPGAVSQCACQVQPSMGKSFHRNDSCVPLWPGSPSYWLCCTGSSPVSSHC